MPTPVHFVPAVAVVILLTACATEAPDPEVAASFSAIDSNEDDMIEAEEFQEAFDRFDLDDDGEIEASENAALVYEADGNRDGVVTPEEFQTIDLARLEVDANVDGRISRRELERYTRQTRSSLGPQSATRGAPSELGPENRWINFRF